MKPTQTSASLNTAPEVTKSYTRKQNSPLVKLSSVATSKKLMLSQEMQKILQQLVDSAATKSTKKTISRIKRLELKFFSNIFYQIKISSTYLALLF